MLILALVATSCTKDEDPSNAPSNPDQIGFTTSTTRAAIANLAAIEASPNGFKVYATSAATPAAWYGGIDGTSNYKKTAGVWGWTIGNPQWPTTAAGYPMNFYAYFASSYTGLMFTSPTPTAMIGSYTIQPETTQVDFLATKATTTSKPASGMLPLTFNHILSKVNFGVIPGYGATVFVQSVNVNNVGDQRSFDFLAGDWTTQQPSTFAANYSYKNTTNPATSLTGVDVNETTPISVTPNYSNLMLMPQTATTWTPAKGAAAANAYMGIIYRLQTSTNVNAIGYASANSHPNFDPVVHAALSGKPLFVKVGYPFASNTMTWAKGKGYTYNICLGTAGASNGYIVNNFYYDEAGSPTTLPIIGKDKGEPINNGSINFIIDVTNWEDQAPGTIQ